MTGILCAASRISWRDRHGRSRRIRSILPRCDGVRNLVHAVDHAGRSRASLRLDAVQRPQTRCAPHVASTPIQALEAIGESRRHRHHADGSGTLEYQLSPAGEELRPIVMSMGFWGQRWVESRLSLKNLDPSLLMWDMRRNLNPAAPATGALHDSVSVPRTAGTAEKLVAGGRKRRRSTCAGSIPAMRSTFLCAARCNR